MMWEFPLSAKENYVRYIQICQRDRHKSDLRRVAEQWRKTYVAALLDARRQGLQHLQAIVSDRVRLSLPMEKRTSERLLHGVVLSWAWDWPLSKGDIARRNCGAELACEDESERLLEKEQAVILSVMQELRKVGAHEKKLLKILANRRHHKHGVFDSSEPDVTSNIYAPSQHSDAFYGKLPTGDDEWHFQAHSPQSTDTSKLYDESCDDTMVTQGSPTPQRAHIACACGRVLDIRTLRHEATNVEVHSLVPPEHVKTAHDTLPGEVALTTVSVSGHAENIFLDAHEDAWRDLPGAQTRVPIPEHDVIFHDALEHEWYDLPDVQTRVLVTEDDLIFYDAVDDEWYDLPEVYTRPALVYVQQPMAVCEDWQDLPDVEEGNEENATEEEKYGKDEEETDEVEVEEGTVEGVEEEEECRGRPGFLLEEDDDSAASCSTLDDADIDDSATTDVDATYKNQDSVLREKCMLLAACRRQKRSYTLSAESTQASITGSLPGTPRHDVTFLKRKKKSFGSRYNRFARTGATMHDTPRGVMVNRGTQASFDEPEMPFDKPEVLRSRSWACGCAPFLTLVSFYFSVFIVYLVAFDPLPPSSNFA